MAKQNTRPHKLEDSKLTPDEKATVAAVFRSVGSLTASEQEMSPGLDEWSTNHGEESLVAAFDRMSPEYREMVAAIAKIPLRELEHGEYEVVGNIEDAGA